MREKEGYAKIARKMRKRLVAETIQELLPHIRERCDKYGDW